MADPVADLTGTTVGRFTVRVRLGAGGMGEVYRADDTKLKRSVALKRMAPHLRADARYRQRFLKEAERASRLTDQHIAGLYDVLEEGGEIFLVMEYVEGETLRQRLQRPLPTEQFLEIAGQCAEALVAAHQKDIVHRDLKPENIMLTPTGRVKVLDFGVAKRLPRPDETADTAGLDSVRSTAGGLSGTPAYMAPETLLEKEADGRADIFSLGVVFYEALTGRHPFLAASFVATSDRILREPPAPLTTYNPRAPVELERIVAKMLAKRPDERYQTAADLLVDLRALERGAPLPGLRAVPVRGRRRALPAAALALLLLAALLVPAVRERLLCAVGRCPVPAEKNLVVLPFRAIGGNPQDQVHCDGLTETVTARLTQLTLAPDLQVSPAGDVRRRAVASVEEARHQFGANLVLEASWQRADDTVRINLTLVDARTGRQLRSDTLTADARDLFALQDRTVESAGRMLEVEFPPGLAGERSGTSVPGAYDYYLQGRGYLQNYDKPENLDNAVRVFERALALDPRYARAYAGLGDASWLKYVASKDPQWVGAARQACERALALDPQLAAAQVCLGTVANGTGRYREAAAAFQLALEREPTSDDAYRGLGQAYERLGKAAEAERTYRRALELRPRYWAGYIWLGTFYVREARYPEAVARFRQAAELAPDNVHAYRNLGGVYILTGQYAEAIAAFRQALAIHPTAEVDSNLGIAYLYLRRFPEAVQAFEEAARLGPLDYRVVGNLARAYYWAGRREKARETYAQAVSLAQTQLEVNPDDPDVHVLLAHYLAMLGRRREALDHLQTALRSRPQDPEFLFLAALVHNQLGQRAQALDFLEKAGAQGYSRAEIAAVPELDSLRSDPRLRALLEPR